ncbi:MAG: DNA topoisomerase [Promethearchaeota archaeon]
MPTLIISEKNKAAKAIAEALGPVSVINKSKILKIYQIPSRSIYVVPLRGHILEYRNTDQYKSWTKTDPREIITNPKAIAKVAINYAKPYIKTLAEYSKLCDECVIATDADIEGCNIGLFDALPFVTKINRNIKVNQLWLSSLEKKEIVSKYRNLIIPKWSWGESGEARAIIDAFIGFSSTREITNTFKPILDEINNKFVSIGRVQTSLLYLIYLRDLEIEQFIPEPYWTITANLEHDNQIIKAFHTKNPFTKEKESEAKAIFQKIKNEKIATILNNTKESIIINPPTPLNTSKALILLTKTLRISAKTAMNTMNSLYLNQIISYPRTDSDKYKPDFDHKQYLENFKPHTNYGAYTVKLFKSNRMNPTIGRVDAGDHPPITPLEGLEQNSSKLENEIERKVYDLLARHYLALFGEEAKELRTKLRLSIKDELFTSQIVALTQSGFYEIAPFLKKVYQPLLEIQAKNLLIDKILLNEKETQPPPHYSDTTLLKLMEREHLGTKSTRPTIIKILLDRKLTYRVAKNRFKITEWGKYLISELIKVWLPFLKPEFTSFVEELLEDIKNKKKTMDSVVTTVKELFLDLFDKFRNSKIAITFEFDKVKGNLKAAMQQNFPQTTSMCPTCKKNPMNLVTISSNKRFLGCSDRNCKTYLPVPKKGNISILKSTNCLKCGFNVFKIIKRKNNKTIVYYICPKCWSDSFKDESDGFCSSCTEFQISKEQCIKRN